MNQYPLVHACKTLTHKCGNYVYENASRKIYFCCNYCKEPCADECKNLHTKCGMHCMRANKRKQQDVPGGFHTKTVLAVNPDTNETVKEWPSLTSVCEELKVSPEVMRLRIKKGMEYNGYLYAFGKEPSKMRTRPVVKINPETREIAEEWDSMADAAAGMGVTQETLRNKIKNGTVYKGYNFMFKEAFEELEGMKDE